MELGPPDESGRRRPIPKEGAFFTLPADSLMTATGELPDTETFAPLMNIENGLVVTDEYGRTSHGKVFAGGDVVTGASTVVNAVARGRSAAQLISAELLGNEFNPAVHKKIVGISDINAAYFLHRGAAAMPHSEGINARDRFTEVHTGYNGDQLQQEIDRCLSCGVCDGCDNCYVFCPDVAISRRDGVYTIDYDYCKGCLICAQECPRGVISTESEAN
jgi:ferredoxin